MKSPTVFVWGGTGRAVMFSTIFVRLSTWMSLTIDVKMVVFQCQCVE
jgi:hypothetical protein